MCHSPQKRLTYQVYAHTQSGEGCAVDLVWPVINGICCDMEHTCALQYMPEHHVVLLQHTG